MDVELTEFILHGTDDPSRVADVRVPFLDLEELIRERTPVIGTGDQGLDRQRDQDRSRIRRATPRLLIGTPPPSRG